MSRSILQNFSLLGSVLIATIFFFTLSFDVTMYTKHSNPKMHLLPILTFEFVIKSRQNASIRIGNFDVLLFTSNDSDQIQCLDYGPNATVSLVTYVNMEMTNAAVNGMRQMR